MEYLPKFPLHLNSIILLGITLLLGLTGGEIARRIRYLPQISGYILVGFLIGPGGFNIVNTAVLTNTHIFIDISLSLILFELGRHLDFRWLRADLDLLLMSLSESILTFLLVFCVLFLVAGMGILPSALAGTIAVATSPAVVMMVAYDLSAEGPVTRRAFILTSLNNLYALILFVILSAMTKPHAGLNLHLFYFISYRLLGSIFLGIGIFVLLKLIAFFIGKHKENQFVLFVGAVLFALGCAQTFNLSSMLTLFVLGAAARNLDWRHSLMEIDFGWLARLFFVVLFVVTGVHLKMQGLLHDAWIVLAFIFARFAAKLVCIWLLAKRNRLTHQQHFALGLALFPMAGVAIGMSNILIDFNPDFGNRLLLIITAAVALLNFIGPVTTQLAFMMTGEALMDKKLQI